MAAVFAIELRDIAINMDINHFTSYWTGIKYFALTMIYQKSLMYTAKR